jgi:hypothetical protein
VALKRRFPRDLDAWLPERGWYTWYNDNYWVHEKLVADPTRQDPTDYGLNAKMAYAFEVLNIEPFASMGLPGLSGMVHARNNWQRIKAFLEEHE